jgi:hypothetical protein
LIVFPDLSDQKNGKMDDFDYNVMMDLDDDFARDNGGYGGYMPGQFPYDPTFNPHGVGAYSEFDGSNDDGYDLDQSDEYEEWQQPPPVTETVARTTMNRPTLQAEQVQVTTKKREFKVNLNVN